MIYDVWIRAPIVVDTMCTVIITMPFISNNICAIAAGVYALRGDNYMASQFTNALYYLWTFYTGFQAILILYAGLRLLRLLNRHLLQRTDSRVDLGRVRLGALKVMWGFDNMFSQPDQKWLITYTGADHCDDWIYLSDSFCCHDGALCPFKRSNY